MSYLLLLLLAWLSAAHSPCHYDECHEGGFWDASTRGNRIGTSFVTLGEDLPTIYVLREDS